MEKVKSGLMMTMMIRLAESCVPELSEHHPWMTATIRHPHRSKSQACDDTHLQRTFPSVRSSSHDLIVVIVDVNKVFLQYILFISTIRWMGLSISSPWNTDGLKVAKFKDSVLLHISQRPQVDIDKHTSEKSRSFICPVNNWSTFRCAWISAVPWLIMFCEWYRQHPIGRHVPPRTYWLPWISVNVPPVTTIPLAFESKPVDDGDEGVNACRNVPWIYVQTFF